MRSFAKLYMWIWLGLAKCHTVMAIETNLVDLTAVASSKHPLLDELGGS